MVLALAPPLDPHHLFLVLLQTGALLAVALVLGRTAVRLGLPAVVGELCAGVLVGPTVLGHLAPRAAAALLPATADQAHLLEVVGQLGVLLLVGITGADIDLGAVRKRAGTALIVGLAGLLVPLGLGIGAGRLVPRSMLPHGANPWVFSLFMGVAMCVSALPVIAKTLSDMNLLHRDIGQLTLTAGVVNDVLGWVLLSFVSALAVDRVHAAGIGAPLLYVAATVGAALTVGRVVVDAVLRWASRDRGQGATVAAAFVVIVLCAAGTQALGIEAVFGALIGGILVGSSRSVDLAGLAPLRTVTLSVFAPLFFATAGLRIDLAALRHPQVLGTALALLVAAVAGKFAGAFLGALATSLNRWEALALGAGMNARGVVQIVVATAGLSLGVLSPVLYTVVIFIAIATSLMAPPILKAAARRIACTEEEEARLLNRTRHSGGGTAGPAGTAAPARTDTAAANTVVDTPAQS